MTDHATGKGAFTVGETVSAYLNGNEGVAAAATATAGSGASAGIASFTGLQPNKRYTLVGGTSGNRVNIFTGEDGLGVTGHLPGATKLVEVVFDAANVAAATGAVQNITLPAGTVDVGDVAVYAGRSGTSGAVSIDVGPIVTADTLPCLIVNGSAAGIDLGSQTYRFLVFKKRTNI